MPHIDYPAFSLDPIQDVVRAVRAGTLRDDLPLAAKCAWEIVGMGLGATVGEPAEHPHGFGANGGEEANVEDLEACRDGLQQLDVQTFGAAGDSADAEAIDPATLTMLIQLAVSIITKLIERRKNR